MPLDRDPLKAPKPGHADAYQTFPDVTRRNATQEFVEIPVMLMALGVHRGGRVLEVGCGRGVALPALTKHLDPARLVGLDIDGELLSEAQGHLSRRNVSATLVHDDVRSMPFSRGEFDIVIDFGTCYHISRPERALAEISRVLACGGLFLTETPLNQFLSHPVRSFGRRIPWGSVPELRLQRNAVMWTRWMRV